MKKLLIFAAGCIAIAAIVAVVNLRQQQGPPAGPQTIVASPPIDPKSAPSNSRSTSAGTNLAPAVSQPPQTGNFNPDDPARQQNMSPQIYDTGIKNDRRIKSTKTGKTMLTEGVDIASRLHSPNISPEEDLETIDELLGLFRMSFNENPLAGDNQMVMEALLGGNSGDLIVFPPDHPAIDDSGQLLDRWGTPYFFHALSGQQMEIFSAGPDQKFNTQDDIQFSDRDGQPLTGEENIELEIDP